MRLSDKAMMPSSLVKHNYNIKQQVRSIRAQLATVAEVILCMNVHSMYRRLFHKDATHSCLVKHNYDTKLKADRVKAHFLHEVSFSIDSK